MRKQVNCIHKFGIQKSKKRAEQAIFLINLGNQMSISYAPCFNRKSFFFFFFSFQGFFLGQWRLREQQGKGGEYL